MTPCYTRHETAPGTHADIPHEHERHDMSETETVGYVVVEYNQASGQPSIPMASEVESLEDAKVTKLYYEGVARKTGRRERYAIGAVTVEATL